MKIVCYFLHRIRRCSAVEAWASFAAWSLISLGKYKYTLVSKGEASLGFDKTNNNGEDLLRVRYETMIYAQNVGVPSLFCVACARGLIVPLVL